jgi:hypothetical protein
MWPFGRDSKDCCNVGSNYEQQFFGVYVEVFKIRHKGNLPSLIKKMRRKPVLPMRANENLAQVYDSVGWMLRA